jgi:hypothetical protein
MNIFKSIWLKMRKSTGLPGNTVLIPMVEQNVPEVTPEPKVKKPRKPRVKKEKKINDSNS